MNSDPYAYVKIAQVNVKQAESFTVFLVPDFGLPGDQHQIELRVLEDGTMQVFSHADSDIQFLSFDDWHLPEAKPPAKEADRESK